MLPDIIENLGSEILKRAAGKPRFFVAVAGAPASGKSTLCDALEQQLATKTSVAVVAMDGFHYDNSILKENGKFARKGAPDTFDATGLNLLLKGLHQQTDLMATPVFDREQDLARSSAKLIHPNDQIILIEGNYLLCDTHPWNLLHVLFDLTIMLNVEHAVLEERLIKRWLDNDHTKAQATKRAQSNDLPNAKYVSENSIQADINV